MSESPSNKANHGGATPGPPFVSVEAAGSITDAWWHAAVGRAISRATFCLCGEVYDADLGPRALDAISRAVGETGSGFSRTSIFENSPWEAKALFVHESGLVVLIGGRRDLVSLTIWATDEKAAELAREKIVAAVPTVKPIGREDLVPFAFWRTGLEGTVSYHVKDVVCPSLEAIGDNYARCVRDKLEELASLEKPYEGGKIVLWHGPAGTGKTHAVRALAREWVRRHNATAEVVLDPEAMLGTATYMHSILLSEQRPRGVAKVLRRRSGHDSDPSGDADDRDAGLRLIILEDAAELFSSGCRNAQGFSRFLNLTDGIVGQGLRCVFLLTANEEIGRIDEALTRHGRCLQSVEFEVFDQSEAQAWLERHGADAGRCSEGATLAELYALTAAKPLVAKATMRVGF